MPKIKSVFYETQVGGSEYTVGRGDITEIRPATRNGEMALITYGYKVIMTKRMKAQINKSDDYSDGMYECEVGDWYITGVKPRRKK